MSEAIRKSNPPVLISVVVVASVAFLYATVLAKLGRDWWTDENYSHGLLVPFVIAFVIWQMKDAILARVDPAKWLGGATVIAALLMLIAGTLGAELFMQRISLVVMLAGVVIYFLGRKVLMLIAVPFALLLLAIPIPQIVFNRIAFPLQIWASQMAVWGIRLFEVPTLRKGNVIDILPKGSTQTISLEVVEACSGIRSLMTLVTLSLILAYFTRRDDGGGFANLSKGDFSRAVILMIAAVPIAVLTNAARVTGTGVMTYLWGKQATDGPWHDASGWVVYVVALAILIGLNALLKRFLKGSSSGSISFDPPIASFRTASAIPLIAVLIVGGVAVNWFANRAEASIERKQLTNLPEKLGEWQQRGSEFKFNIEIEGLLKVSDYTMREYTLEDGRVGNIYVGYYESQRGGATYHSPQNCLPGAGWVMKDPQFVEVPRGDGTTFTANRYVIENGIYNEVMIYWYQGRGRTEASEYRDKVNTVLDSVTRRRSDGSMVRVMTSVGQDEAAAIKAATNLAAKLADVLPPYVPE